MVKKLQGYNKWTFGVVHEHRTLNIQRRTGESKEVLAYGGKQEKTANQAVLDSC